MKLSQLLANVYPIVPEWDRKITQIVTDSRVLQAGDLFLLAALDDKKQAEIIAQAVTYKPVAIVVDAQEGFQFTPQQVPIFYIPNLTQHIPALLQQFYDSVKNMQLVGVTGTNGKSSITHFIAQLASACAKPCALLGTLGNGLYPDIVSTANTTSDLATNLATLEKAQKQGAMLAAIEVSSHGIAQKRIQGLDFSIGVFTNLSQDHLDYHGSMRDYFSVKQRFINQSNLDYALICIDDEYGQALFRQSTANQSISYGQHDQAQVRYEVMQQSVKGIQLKLITPWGESQVQLPLLGEFNAANVLASVASLCLLGFDFKQVCAALGQLQGVSGRMQVFSKEHAATVVLDFAHTPDALSCALQALQIGTQKPNLVFGCGGNRDRSKRPLMAQAADQFAAKVWLTDDNPRDEDSAQIFTDVLSGVAVNGFVCEHQRATAIASAVAASGVDDVLLIAGKGHESYQEIKGIKHPYSDVQTLLDLGFLPRGGNADAN